jgi:phospholipid/cholesterol/gamma-HCH transport system substrate-binding protein
VKVSREVKIGLLLLVAIALFIFGFNYLKGTNIFKPQKKYYAVYERIEGLVEANPVQINGYSIGQVNKIDLEKGNTGRIIIEFTVNKSDLPLPDNSVAKIVSSDLLGSKAVQIILGNSNKYLQSGDTLLSDVESTLGETVNKQVLPLKNKAEKLISSIDSVLAVIQYIFNEDSQEDIKQSLESVNSAIRTLKKTALRVDTLVNEQRFKLSRISTNIESITLNLKNNNDKLAKIFANLQSVTDSLAKANLTSTVNNANRALAQAAAITEKINKGEGTMGMLVNNDTLYKNLNSAARDLDLLLKDLKDHPSRYVQVSVFGKKEKKDKKSKNSSQP